jgi:predicted membrane-bound spermidine synthase
MFAKPISTAIVLGGGEGCTTNQIISSSFAGHVTQIDHDRQAIEWADRMLSTWNQDIYSDTLRVNVIYEDAFALAKRDNYVPTGARAAWAVIDLFDPDISTLHDYCELLGSVANKWIDPSGGIVAYFGLWPNASICPSSAARSACGPAWDIHGYTHYIPSFCAECLFLVIVPADSPLPQLEEGSTWRF